MEINFSLLFYKLKEHRSFDTNKRMLYESLVGDFKRRAFECSLRFAQ